MINLPKWNERSIQEEVMSPSKTFGHGLLDDWENSALPVKIRNEASRERKKRSLKLPKECDLKCRAVAISLKAIFFTLVRNWSWEMVFRELLFWKILCEQLGTVDFD